MVNLGCPAPRAPPPSCAELDRRHRRARPFYTCGGCCLPRCPCNTNWASGARLKDQPCPGLYCAHEFFGGPRRAGARSPPHSSWRQALLHAAPLERTHAPWVGRHGEGPPTRITGRWVATPLGQDISLGFSILLLRLELHASARQGSSCAELPPPGGLPPPDEHSTWSPSS